MGEQGEFAPSSEEAKESEEGGGGEGENVLFQIVPRVRQRVIDSFSAEARGAFEREFKFFDSVTSISATLKPIPKSDRKAAIRP